jgi:hypothetical protein
MDRYRIKFVCHTTPESSSRLVGFQKGTEYEGRHFNGLYEISTKWGVTESTLVGERVFNKYFEKIQIEELIKQPA